MSMSPEASSSPRPQRLVRTPTNPVAARPGARHDPIEPGAGAEPGAPALAGPAPIHSIAADLEGAPGWHLALIAVGVAVVSALALLVAS